jgi:hypothetical protein
LRGGDFHKKNYTCHEFHSHIKLDFCFFLPFGSLWVLCPWGLDLVIVFFDLCNEIFLCDSRNKKNKNKNHFDSDLFDESTGNCSELSLPCLTHRGKHRRAQQCMLWSKCNGYRLHYLPYCKDSIVKVFSHRWIIVAALWSRFELVRHLVYTW